MKMASGLSLHTINIARANFKAAPPTFDFNEDVIRMDDTSIVTKHFLDTKMELKYRNEDGVYTAECVLFEVHEGPFESEPRNFTGSSPDSNKRRQLRNWVICAVVLLLVVVVVVIIAVFWNTLKRDHNGDGTPADCCFIRGQLPTPCPRADGLDWV